MTSLNLITSLKALSNLLGLQRMNCGETQLNPNSNQEEGGWERYIYTMVYHAAVKRKYMETLWTDVGQ